MLEQKNQLLEIKLQAYVTKTQSLEKEVDDKRNILKKMRESEIQLSSADKKVSELSQK